MVRWLLPLAFVLVAALLVWSLTSVRSRDRAEREATAPEETGAPSPAVEAATEAATDVAAPVARLRVRVLSAAGGPLADAEVRVTGDGREECARTGQDGFAEVDATGPPPAWIAASREGYRAAEQLVPAGVDELEVVLVPGVPVRGVVVRAGDGAPVPGAEVFVGDRVADAGASYELTADADGRFAAAGMAIGAQFIVGARAPGFAPAVATGLLGAEPVEVRVTLGVGARVEGAVQDAGGGAARDVAVWVLPRDDPFLGQFPDATQLGANSLRAAARTRTGDAGRFSVAGLAAPGAHVLLARASDGAEARAMFSASHEAEVVRLVLTLQPTGRIRLRVTDPNGAAVARAHLIFRSGGSEQRGSTVPAATDERGEALASGLEPGEYEVIVWPTGWAPSRAAVTVARGACAELEVRVEPGLALEGEVREQSGAPVAGLLVTFSVPGDERGPRHYVRSFTDRHGRFRLDGLLPRAGEVTVSDYHDRFTGWTASDLLPGGSPLAIVVRRSGGLEGRFEPPPPSRRAAWMVAAGSGRSARDDLVLDEQGRFVLTGLPEGEPFDLFFRVPGGRPVRCEIAPLGPGERRDLGTLAVAPGRALRGRVVDQHGRPWGQVRVEVMHEELGLDTLALTDAGGAFVVEDLDAEADVSIVVWFRENEGRCFEFGDWTAEPLLDLVVERE